MEEHASEGGLRGRAAGGREGGGAEQPRQSSPGGGRLAESKWAARGLGLFGKCWSGLYVCLSKRTYSGSQKLLSKKKEQFKVASPLGAGAPEEA